MGKKWNMEQVTCLMSMILQITPDLKGTGNIKRKLKQRILEWEEKTVLHLFTKEIDGVRERKWNKKKVMCLVSMILQITPDLKGTGNIKRKLKQRILEWEEKTFDILNSSTIICTEVCMNRKRGGFNTKERVKSFSSLICRG